MLRKKSQERRRGTTLLETAMVMPIFILLVFGIFEYGRFQFVRHVMDNAAREGARYAVVNTHLLTTTQINDYTRSRFAVQAQQFTATPSVSVYFADAAGEPTTGKNWYDAPFGQAIGVRIEGEYKVILFGMLGLPSTVKMTATSLMKSEGN